MPKFDLVIFDNDGVLVDSEKTYPLAWQHVLKQHNLELSVAECQDFFVGKSVYENVDWVCKEFSLNLDLENIKTNFYNYAHAILEKELEPIKGAVECVQNLCVPYCLATSALPQSLAYKLKWAGIEHLFAENPVFTASMVQKGKPAPDLFLLAAEKMNTSPEKCLVVEDSQYGIQGAKSAGMTAVGFIGGSHYLDDPTAARQKLLDAGADIVIEEMQELLEIVDGKRT